MESQQFEYLTVAGAGVRSSTLAPDLTRFVRRVAGHRHLILLLCVLTLCAYLRFVNMGWGLAGKYKAGWHPDEQIVVGIDGNLAANHFDTDMKRAPIPPGLQGARYNFSSYSYAAYLWSLAAEPVAALLHSKPMPVLVYRQFSALLGWVACLLVYGCSRIFLSRWFALLATLFTGVLPILVQDSHYARAEAFVTAGTVGALWMSLLIVRSPTVGRCCRAGLLTGVLTACKISLAPLLALPVCAAAACYLGHRKNLAGATRTALVLFAAFVAGFLLGVPYILVHPRDWWQGWHHLSEQYSHPFAPYGTDPPGYCFGFIARYFISTLGWPLLIAAGAGIFRLARRGQYLLLLLLAGPVALYYLIFGFQLAFFERNLSHIAPSIAMLAALGCQELFTAITARIRFPRLRAVAVAMVVMLCLWRPFTLSWRIAVLVFSGHTYDPMDRYQSAISAAYPGLPLVGDAWWSGEILRQIGRDLGANPGGFILKISDANDELSEHQRFAGEHIYNMKLLAVAPGFFADLPVCTLHMYHSQNYSWYLVRR